MRAQIACVGLIVLVGCFTLVFAPDDSSDLGPVLPELPTIVIDAGHGGIDSGARCRGVTEKVLTLDTALRVNRALQKLGYRTILTRTDDHYVSLPNRVEVANALNGPALFVSIHFNQGSEGDINGVETFYASFKAPHPRDWTWVGFFNPVQGIDSGENLAALVQTAVIAKTGARDRGIRARDLYVTRSTRVPAILIEGGFISNTMEAHLLGTDGYANLLAQGIADGVDAWCHSQTRPIPNSLAKTP